MVENIENKRHFGTHDHYYGGLLQRWRVHTLLCIPSLSGTSISFKIFTGFKGKGYINLHHKIHVETWCAYGFFFITNQLIQLYVIYYTYLNTRILFVFQF